MTASRRSPRPALLLAGSLAAVALALAGLLLALRSQELPAADGAVAVDPAARSTTPEPARILREWNAQRAAAWVAGDEGRLAALYVPGSAAGRADQRLLRRYLDRGLRLRGLQTQLLAVSVRRATPGELVVEVTDRLVAGDAVAADGSVVRLPADRPSSHVVTLRRVGAAWLVARVAPG